MSGYIPYNPEQDWLLPPSVQDELGHDPLVFFLHQLVARPARKGGRGMRQFRRRGLIGVASEGALATTAFNLTRMFAQKCSVSR